MDQVSINGNKTYNNRLLRNGLGRARHPTRPCRTLNKHKKGLPRKEALTLLCFLLLYLYDSVAIDLIAHAAFHKVDTRCS